MLLEIHLLWVFTASVHGLSAPNDNGESTKVSLLIDRLTVYLFYFTTVDGYIILFASYSINFFCLKS